MVVVRPARQLPWPPAAMNTKAAGVAVVAEAVAIMLRHVAVVVAEEVEVEVIRRQTIAMIMTIVNIMHRRPRARRTDAVVATMITHRHRRPSPQCCPTAAAPIVTRIMGSAASGDAAASTRRSTSIDNTHAVAAAARVAAAAATVADGIDTNGSGTRKAAGIDTTITMTIETGNESGSARGNGSESGNANGTARKSESENDAIDRSR